MGLVPLFVPENMWLEGLGYVLAGFVPILMMGLDNVWQRRGFTNPNFTPKPGYTRSLRFIALAGFVIAIWNLALFAQPVAEYFSNLWVG